MIYIIFYLIAWILGFILFFTNRPRSFLQNMITAHFLISVGLFGFWNFMGHVFMSERVAQSIGWVSNGFQIEIGFVSLGMGIAGILCYWFRNGFWWATLIPYSTFLLGAAGNHIKEMIEKGNFNPGNSIIVIPDILMPLTILVLMIINYIKERKAKSLSQ